MIRSCYYDKSSAKFVFFRAVTENEMSQRVFPDFCPGWAYVIFPSFGVKLAEFATTLPELAKMKRLDDIFVTGNKLYRPNSSVIKVV